MSRRPKHFRQLAWDSVDAKYADISNPEWVLNDRLPSRFWTDPHNHRRYMKWLAIELKISDLDDWYRVTSSDIISRRGDGLLEYYSHSHIQLIMAMHPGHDWFVWKFNQVPNRFWDDLKNVKAYVKWFEKQNGIRKKSDWHRIQQDDLYDHCGGGLMDHYQCSVIRLLRAAYPDHDWKPWLFSQVTKNFWTDRRSRIEYLKWLGNQLGYKKPEDWYQLTRKDLTRYHGISLLLTSGLSRVEFLAELYPKLKWHEWKFKQVTPAFWDDASNRIRYLNWLGKELGYKSQNDWYKVMALDFSKNFGTTLIHFFYYGDLTAPLKELFPKSEWHAWKFRQVPAGFWDSIPNCQSYLSWLADQLGLKTKEDWYQVSRNDFFAHYGNGFIKRFKTPYKGLALAYPEYEWIPWLFDYAPSGFWGDAQNRKRYLTWLGHQLDFHSPEDWLELSAKQLRDHRGGGLLVKQKLGEIRAEGKATIGKEKKKGRKDTARFR